VLVPGGPGETDHVNTNRFDTGTGGKVLWGHDIRFCKRMWEAGHTYRPVTDKSGGLIPLPGGKFAIDPDGARRPWEVHMAGWVLCMHFDIARQMMYGLPKDSPPARDKNTRSYWDHVWKGEGYETGRTYKNLYDRVVELVPEGCNVVDFGCGIGVLMDRLVKQKRVRAYGYDISEEAIKMVKDRWLEGEVCDAKDFQLNRFPNDGTVFVCTETIEHLENERLNHLLDEAAKAGGAIFSTPDGDLKGTPAGEHQQIFDEDRLRTLLAERFKSVQIERVTRGEKINDFLLAVCSNAEVKNE